MCEIQPCRMNSTMLPYGLHNGNRTVYVYVKNQRTRCQFWVQWDTHVGWHRTPFDDDAKWQCYRVELRRNKILEELFNNTKLKRICRRAEVEQFARGTNGRDCNTNASTQAHNNIHLLKWRGIHSGQWGKSAHYSVLVLNFFPVMPLCFSHDNRNKVYIRRLCVVQFASSMCTFLWSTLSRRTALRTWACFPTNRLRRSFLYGNLKFRQRNLERSHLCTHLMWFS